MPKYFIDTDDGDLHIKDEEGLEFFDLEAARDAAQQVLPDMARQKMPDGEQRDFRAVLRDEHGLVLYIVTLSLKGEWYVTHSTP